MLQDIKTFSDLTAIKTEAALLVELEYKVHGHCIATVSVNNCSVTDNKSQFQVDLFDPINLTVKLDEFEEGSSGIEIVNFSVNGLEILPKYQHLASRSTNYIDFLEKFIFEIDAPFYVWYHQITGQGWIA